MSAAKPAPAMTKPQMRPTTTVSAYAKPANAKSAPTTDIVRMGTKLNEMIASTKCFSFFEKVHLLTPEARATFT